ncbi:ribonuclease III [Corallococcus exercitus]|uniref:Ribonuclease 3 n=2 Tax=Corallococcus exercitus TaxID=2316736 RepID=A0A3A8HTH6_9BACT|nr:ribonuclease III [Corallococcus exercitus]RKG73868.1 ribonuclease III [Corallococcus exercitus]
MEKMTLAERVQALEARLGVQFSKRDLALEALTHKTYVNENRDQNLKDNQRLEFLGDAVVDLAVSHRLMDRCPGVPEGELTKMRARIVHEEGLARVARSLRLGELLLLGRGESQSGGRDKNSLLADALEAVLGAVYLSGGLEPALALVDRCFGELVEEVASGAGRLDYKTLLQELSHERLKLSPRYRVVSETGPEHSKVFEVEVCIGETVYARATGRNKKEAEQAAARTTLERLKAEAAAVVAPAVVAPIPGGPSPDDPPA